MNTNTTDHGQHLVRMGKGQYASFKPVEYKNAYIGATGKEPFDPKQAELNHKLGYC